MQDDDAAVKLSATSTERLEQDVRRQRLDLLHAHQLITQVDEVDDDDFDRVVRLTKDLLQREEAAARTTEDAERAVSRRIVMRNGAVLGVVAVALLLVGLLTAWWSAWGVTLLSAAAGAAALVLSTHTSGHPAGHRSRRTISAVILIVGLVAVAVAPEWASWWVRLLVLVALLGTVIWFGFSFAQPTAPRTGSRA